MARCSRRITHRCLASTLDAAGFSGRRHVGWGAIGYSAASVAIARFDLSLKENMPPDKDLHKRIQRIGEMVEQLESAADPNARAMAKELLESLMALHGAALERILQLASDAGEPGEAIIRKCGRDDLVGGVLLLYGLHPENLRTRVTRA